MKSGNGTATHVTHAETTVIHAIDVETDSLRCPQCGCNIRLRLTVAARTPKVIVNPPEVEASTDKTPTDLEPQTAEALQTMESAEKDLILRTLQQSAHNRLLAAKILGIGRTTIYRRLKKYGLATGIVQTEIGPRVKDEAE
jgi:DNA-binding NtrC family response regulator